MKRLWTTFLGVCLSVAGVATASAQEGAPVASGGYAGGGYAGGGYAGGSFTSGGHVGGGGVVAGGCATGDCGTGSCGPGGCLPHCQKHHCPVLYHCQEGGVRYKTHIGCPRPVCNPCNNPGWGYFETCWNPWPFPPDYSHCRKVPPAAAVVLNPNAMPTSLPGNYPTQGDPNYRPQPTPTPQRAPMPSETRLAPPINDRQQFSHGAPMPRQAPPGYTYQSGSPVPTVPVAIDNAYQQQPQGNFQQQQQGGYQQQPPMNYQQPPVGYQPQQAPANYQQPRAPMPQDGAMSPPTSESRIMPPVTQPVAQPQPVPSQQPFPPAQNFAPRYQ